MKQWNKYNAPLDQNAGRDKILGCMGCKAALNLSNPDDCEWFAKICGKRTVRTQGLSSQKRGSRFATGDTESYTEHADDLVHPWELATRNPIRDGILVSKSAENPSPGREGVFQFKVDYANNTPAGHFFGLGTEKECDAKRVAFYQRELRRHVNVIEDTVPCWAPDFNFQSGQTADIKADEWSAWEDR